MMFKPLDMQFQKRMDVHRAARLSMLHDRVAKRMTKVDDLADQVEKAAAALVEATTNRFESKRTLGM
ncbi:hypothetical protein RFM98_14910 [Mesorhizobium sp. VK9D]|uniref:hypothetical protein n=1 Tax=Mesorhizobium australafricanum TaxID=3072311 RepID=UPI002A242B0E|nr:hypothetical protein [Mesorhizobium sp. VK9D]MDX8454050.1 hypothetical protein [Mesorhizobium sp. VK9D]